MSPLGEDLRREREQRAVTLKDISDKTKISLRILEALESGRYKDALEPFYVRGILRIYAEFLGLPEDRFLASYKAETGPPPEPEAKSARPVPEAKPPRRNRGSRRKLRRVAVIVLALVLLALLAAAYVFILRPMHGRPPRLPVAKPAAAVTGTAVPAPPVELPPVLGTGAAEAAAELALELTFTADTWIKVAADGEVRIDGIKKAGEKAACAAKREIVLQTGNAGGFAFTVNGRPGRPLGAPGAVLTDVRINRETLAGLLAAPGKPPAAKGGC